MKGFTLLELLVSVGVLAIVSILIVRVFLTTTRANTTIQSQTQVQQDGNFALDAMTRLIRGAVSVDCNGDPTTQSITLHNTDGDTTTIRCESDGVARVASVSGEEAIVYLTGGDLTTNQTGDDQCDANDTLMFTCPAVASATGPISFSFSLGIPLQSFDPTDQSRLFTTTVSPRNQ